MLVHDKPLTVISAEFTATYGNVREKCGPVRKTK